MDETYFPIKHLLIGYVTQKDCVTTRHELNF